MSPPRKRGRLVKTRLKARIAENEAKRSRAAAARTHAGKSSGARIVRFPRV